MATLARLSGTAVVKAAWRSSAAGPAGTVAPVAAGAGLTGGTIVACGTTVAVGNDADVTLFRPAVGIDGATTVAMAGAGWRIPNGPIAVPPSPVGVALAIW